MTPDCMTESIAGALLGAEGPFAGLDPGFAPRAAQQAMAEVVADAIATRMHLLVEAGTGTGKTFAYLVPAILSGQRTLVSTATRTLQDQLFEDDLPRVCRALGVNPERALLKGRTNYLCLHRLGLARGQPGLLAEDQRRLARIEAWAARTGQGDIAEVTGIPEEAAVWPQVTSTVDNCLGQGCAHFDDCFVVRARRKAAAADIVVVNHHLLFADMALREEGFGELLPTVRVIIADEAHQLPELAAQAFGHAVSGRRIRDLVRDCAAAHQTEAPDMPGLAESARALDRQLQALTATLAHYPGRREFDPLHDEPLVAGALRGLTEALKAIGVQLAEASERGPGLEACARRCEEIRVRLAEFGDRDNDDWVRWLEASPRGFGLHATPLTVAEQFGVCLAQSAATWVFCSATLAVEGDFSHFRRELGLDEALAASWDSPFDFARQTLCYLPPIAVNPGDAGFLPAVVDQALEVITLSRGRAFLLCTSHRALEYYAGPLRARLPYPVLVQGEASRATLLTEFRRLGNAVLIGTATFWEGVDVRGEALSCVIIDKLPFAPPDDPVLKARARRLTHEGRDPFRDYQLPVAALTLKQGAGRLIRDITDRGVLVLCDPRLRSKGYGRTFLRALPPMPQTRSLADVAAFFALESTGLDNNTTEGETHEQTQDW